VSTIKVNTIQTAAGTGSLTVPAETGTVVVKDGSNDVTLNDITAGGIYLGGTGGANYLDDYEEGTWTPTFGAQTNPTNTYTNQVGVYTKTGDLVVASFKLSGTYTGGSGSFTTIGGLPFNIGVSGSASSGGLFWGNMALGAGYYSVIPYNSTTGNIYYLGKSGVSVNTANVPLSDFGGSFDLSGVLIYRA